jgi:diguanylate cyclase (GGDEF)-like protein
MRKRPKTERRSTLGAALASKLSFPIDMARSRAWAIVAFGICVIGISDVFTGHAIWLGPVYLIIIGFAAWFLGWQKAVMVGVACMAVTLSANGLRLYPHGGAEAFWNLAVRIIAVLMIIALIDNARKLYEKQWLLARTDQLTGALNRQAFFEIANSIPHTETWSVLVFADLDGLKKLNDNEGHARGDLGLKVFSERVRKLIRKDDIFARIGGDEFLIYLTVKDETAGKAVTARLHQIMNEATATFSPELRCSIGALILAPGRRAIDREVQIADELMYEAKEIGASLRVATVRECRGSFFALPDWALSRTFGESDTADSSATVSVGSHREPPIREQASMHM